MLIFIDESGSFVPTRNLQSSISCVSALAIPESQYERLVGKFELLLQKWGMTSEEPKGRILSESEISQTVTLLERFDVILKIATIDIGMHLPDEIAAHQQFQAAKLTENLGPEHRPALRNQVEELQRRLSDLPMQLYVQATVMTQAADSLIQTATLRYGFTAPEELSAFKWVIDAKDDKRTEYEDLWLTLVSPWLQSNSLRDPLIQVEGGDYSCFIRSNRPDLPEPPSHLKAAVRHADGAFRSTDIKMIMQEHLAFENSSFSRGLQLADILASAFRRGCNGHLNRRGWRNLGRLMIQDVRTKQPIYFGVLSDQAMARCRKRAAYWEVTKELEAKARSFAPVLV